MSTTPLKTAGSIPDIVENVEGLYEGDLTHYFSYVFWEGKKENPYHNFRHVCHVTWLCHDACRFYNPHADVSYISKREARNLLIAGLFHDFAHAGNNRIPDRVNVDTAVHVLKYNMEETDQEECENIFSLIKGTEFPHTPGRNQTLAGRIIRDADLSQCLSESWIQHVIFGLGEELDLKPFDMLEKHAQFVKGIRFETQWAKSTFTPEVMTEKLVEAERLINLLKRK